MLEHKLNKPGSCPDQHVKHIQGNSPFALLPFGGNRRTKVNQVFPPKGEISDRSCLKMGGGMVIPPPPKKCTCGGPSLNQVPTNGSCKLQSSPWSPSISAGLDLRAPLANLE
ncbi:UNVERIFIED_CONTAM: hypothetical protein K2H54_043389 [Gekko kuhli]